MEKFKRFMMTMYQYMVEFNQRRAERAIARELAYFQRIEYRHGHRSQLDNPYSVMFRHDK